MVKRFSARVILGLPQTTSNNLRVDDKTDFSQNDNGISEKVDHVLDILKKTNKNQEKIIEIIRKSQTNISTSQKFKNQPSVNDEKQGTFDNNEKKAPISNNEKEAPISNNEKEPVISNKEQEFVIKNNKDLLTQVEKVSSPKNLQETLIEDTNQLAKQVTKQIETSPMVTEHKEFLEEDLSKSLATISQLNEIKQTIVSEFNDIKQTTALELNQIKDWVVQNQAEVLDKLKCVGPVLRSFFTSFFTS